MTVESPKGLAPQPAPVTSTAWHALPIDEVTGKLGGRPDGLTTEEAERRLERFGPNELETRRGTSWPRLLLHQFQSPLIYILFVAALVSAFLAEYVDVGVILAVVLLNAVIGFTQERQAEASVEALAELVAPRSHLIRDGHEQEVPSREVVPGDVVLLESGMRVPADIRLIQATSLLVNESTLTGESAAVLKQTAPLRGDEVLADRTNMCFAGTTVSSGRGRGYVVATGEATELGAIAGSIRKGSEVATPLQQRLAALSRIIGIIVVVAAAASFVVGLLSGYGVAEMFLVAVALAVSAVPEGLPIAFTITLAVGVRRMAGRNAIIRRLPAVETLGSTTVIGTDKTGTLTTNQMTVREIWAGNRHYSAPVPGAEREQPPMPDGQELPKGLHLTLLTGVLTNEAQIGTTPDGTGTSGDPTEVALLVAARQFGVDPEPARRAYRVVAEIPFEPDIQYSASVRERDGRYELFVKGAPERVAAMCATMLDGERVVPIDPDEVSLAAREMAARGLRVLAMAYAEVDRTTAEQLDPADRLANLTLLGMQGMMDPPRERVREAIEGCRRAGIRVVMITGDHAVTAQAIGRELGIGDDDAPVMTGADMERTDDETLVQRVAAVPIYARVTPEHKLRIVKALQRRHEVVAVTGDGVNDAPALQAADIGVAMGRSGTDVAREAADMVLADDNFVSIYAAVEEGRVTFDNLRKVTSFLLSCGAAEVMTILGALLMSWPLPITAVQILWLNLVTDSLQVMALAFEPKEPGILDRPPRKRNEGILSRILWERLAITGLVMAVGALFLFNRELALSDSLVRAQSVALTTMVISQMFQALNSRSEYRSIFRVGLLTNPWLLLAIVATILIQAGTLYFSVTQFALGLEPVGLTTWLWIAGVSFSVIVAGELHKLIRRRPASGGEAPRPAEVVAPARH